MQRLDPASPVPLYHQIAESIRRRVAQGELPPGAVLPPLREAAALWGVNMHTVRHAYTELARQGLVRARGPAGTTILAAHTSASRAPASSEREFIERTIREARESHNLSPAQLAAAIAEWRPAPGDHAPSVAVIECSDAQCADLADQIAARFRVAAAPWRLDLEADPPEGPIVATYFHYSEVRRRWPHRLSEIYFASIHPDPALPLVVSALSAGNALTLCEFDQPTADAVAADLAPLFPPSRWTISARIVENPLDALRDASSGTPVLFAPRVWAALSPEDRRRPGAIEVRYLFDPEELDAIARRLDWPRHAPAPTPSHQSTPGPRRRPGPRRSPRGRQAKRKVTMRPSRFTLLAALLTLAFFAGAPPSRARADAAPDAATAALSGGGWTMTHLDIDITILPAESKISAEGRMTLRLDADSSPGPTIGMNTRKSVMKFTRMGDPGAAVDLNVAPADAKDARLAHLHLPAPASRGTEITIPFAYESEGKSFQFMVTPEFSLASWVEGWCPAPLPPKGQDFTASLASAPGTTRFHLPLGWRAVSNGKLISRTESPQGAIDSWEITQPVARSFIAAPYTVAQEEVGGRQIGVYLLSPKPVSAPNQAATLAKALAAMEARYGPYPYPSYAIAEVPESAIEWYASSEQGFIMAKSSAFSIEGGNIPLFAHEAAHGWWGNLVNSKGTGAQLCSESLAQYSAVVAIEAIEGEPAMNEFLRFSRAGYSPIQCALGYFYIVREGGDKPMSQLSDGKWDHDLSDSKGHWFYHMLRQRVGDELFFATLRGLIRDYSDKQMSLDDIRAAFIAAAPDKDLTTFFSQWLDHTGAPILDCDWWSIDKGKGAEVHITQRQPGDPYTMPLEIAIETKDGATTLHTLDLHDREQTFKLTTTDRPLNVRLDPNTRSLIWRPEYGPRPEPK